MVGLVCIVAVALITAIHRNRSSSKLLQYKASLRSKGEKLTLAELDQTRSTQFNNGMRLLTNSTRLLAFGGISPGVLEPRLFVSPGRAEPGWQRRLPPAAVISGPATWEYFSEQLSTNAATLDQIRFILKNPPLDLGPITNLLFRPSYNFIALRTAAQWMIADSLDALRLNDRSRALSDIVALGDLAKINSEDYTLVAQMIRVAITGLGVACTWDALQLPGWTEAELSRIQSTWETNDLREGLERAFVGERAIGSEFFGGGHSFSKVFNKAQNASLSDFFSDHVALPAYRMTVAADDELFHLESMQQTLEALRGLQKDWSWVQTTAQLSRITARVNRLATAPQGFMYWFSRISIPNFSKAVVVGIRNETDRQMLLSAIAIKRFEVRNGKLPDSLSDLIPSFLSKLPKDYMAGGPLHYKAGKQGFLLYSVGEDSQDNGGDATSNSLTNRLGLWEGKDAVWPALPEADPKN